MKHILPLLLLLCSFAAISCHNDNDNIVNPTPTPTPVHTRQTVIIYMVAENSLSSSVSSDIQEMIKGADSIPTDCRIVIYLDDTGTPKVYSITSQQGRVTHQGMTERSSTDPEVFRNTLKELCDSFPSDNYGLVMWSHGSGWIPTTRRTIGIDNNMNTAANTGTELEIPDMRTALDSLGKHWDFIFFDACFMQCVESSYELRKVTDYVIASPAEIPGPGAPYKNMMPGFFNTDKEAGVKQIVQSYYDEYQGSNNYGVLISAVKTSEMDSLLSVTRRLLPDFYLRADSLPTEGIQTYCTYCKNSYWKPEYYDMASTMNQVLSTDDYQTWLAQMQRTVFIRRHTNWWFTEYPSTRNVYFTDPQHIALMSIFIPNAKYDVSTDYNAAIKKTQWYVDYTK